MLTLLIVTFSFLHFGLLTNSCVELKVKDTNANLGLRKWGGGRDKIINIDDNDKCGVKGRMSPLIAISIARRDRSPQIRHFGLN